MRQAPDGSFKLTDEEIKNGWTLETALKYQAERSLASGLVGGNAVTAWERPPQPRAIFTTKDYDPITRRQR